MYLGYIYLIVFRRRASKCLTECSDECEHVNSFGFVLFAKSVIVHNNKLHHSDRTL